MGLALCILLMPSIGMAGAELSSKNLAQSKDCFACHSEKEKVVGPAYKDVAAKYAGQGDAENSLIKKVMTGASGTWGRARMPANPQVSEEEARILVKWVLSLNK